MFSFEKLEKEKISFKDVNEIEKTAKKLLSDSLTSFKNKKFKDYLKIYFNNGYSEEFSYSHDKDSEKDDFEEIYDFCDDLDINSVNGYIRIAFDYPEDPSLIEIEIFSKDVFLGVEGSVDLKTEKVETKQTDTGNIYSNTSTLAKYVGYSQNGIYCDEYLENLNSYLGIDDQYACFPIERKVYGWGHCKIKEITPQECKQYFNINVKNSFYLYVLESGETVICTPISLKHSADDRDFADFLDRQHGLAKVGDIFQNYLMIDGENYVFACHSDTSGIEGLKLCSNSTDKSQRENRHALTGFLVKENYVRSIEWIEKYCDKVCTGDYTR